MALKFNDNNIVDSENPFVDLLMYALKILAFNCVIKDQYLADDNETAESAKAGDLYIDCKDDNASPERFDHIPHSFLVAVGMPPAQISLYESYGFDYYYIPKDEKLDPATGMYVPTGTTYERDLKPLLEQDYIEAYENNHYEGEMNNYYRRILGIPDVGEWGVPMIEYEYLLPDGFTYTGYFVHETGTDTCKELERLGVLDVMRAEYPDAKYIDYLAADITAYDARTKYDFQILWCPGETDISYDNSEMSTSTFRSMIEEFEDKYRQNRKYMMDAVYSKAMEIGSEYYHTLMVVYTIIATMADILVEVQSHIIKKDILNRRCVEYIFSMYGIPFFRKIPEKFQEKLVKNVYELIKYKSSATEMHNLIKIFEEDSIKIYKYYILKVRRTNEYGEFIYNESSKLVCIKNDIIDHEEVVEDIDNPPPPQKMPDKVKYYETYAKSGGVKEYYADGSYTSTYDQVKDIEATKNAINNNTANDKEEKVNFNALVEGTDYILRYIVWPFDYFLQKGNVMFVRADDYIMKEGIDYVIYNYNKIKIKKSVLEGKKKITYDFYWDISTIDQDFEVDMNHGLKMKVKKFENLTTNVLDLNPLPWNKYFEEGNQVIVSVNSVWLHPALYTIDYTNNTVTLDPSINYKDKEVYVILLFSEFLKSRFEKHVVTATTNGQTKFFVPDPFPFYTVNENTFFVTIGNVFIDPDRYKIHPSTILDQSYIEFIDGYYIPKGKDIVFNFLYSQNAIINKIDLQKTSIFVTCEKHYQTEFKVTFPIDHYSTCNYCVYIKYLGWYLPYGSYTNTNKKIIILDESLALKPGDVLEVVCIYSKDRTLEKNKNILVTRDHVYSTKNKQSEFNINFPVKHYNTKFNKIIVDVDGHPLDSSEFTVDYNGGALDGKIKINKYSLCPMKNKRVNLIFIYNKDAEYVTAMQIQQLPINYKTKNMFSLDYPFFPYLETGQDFLVILGSTLVAKSRIHMVDQFTFTIDEFEETSTVDRSMTILYIYSNYYIMNANNKLIVDWVDVDVNTVPSDHINVPVPFEQYIQGQWPYFVSYNNRTYMHEDEYDVFENDFYTYPVKNLKGKKYGDIITFTFIYLIKKPWVIEESSEDYEDDMDLKFSRMPLDDLYSSNYLKDQSTWKDYDAMIRPDGWWEGFKYQASYHEKLKQMIYKEKWNYARTKYFTIYEEIDSTEYGNVIGYFFSILYDPVFLEKNLTISVKSLSSSHLFNVAHLFIFLTTLTFINNGINDFVIDRKKISKYVVGFNFSNNMAKINKYFEDNHIDKTKYPIWDFIIPTTQIANMTDFMAIYNKDMEIRNKVIKGMVYADTYSEYKIWKYISDELLQWEFDMSYFTLSTGAPATTYCEFLKDQDPILYSAIMKVKNTKDIDARTDLIVTYVDDIEYMLSSYIDKKYLKYIFDSYPGKSGLAIIHYMMYMLEFFKSYKIVFIAQGQKMDIGANGDENEDSSIKFYDEMKSLEETRFLEYFPIVEEIDSLETMHIKDDGTWLTEDFKITKTIKK